ncbi:aminoglycoside 6-adenylyltransferase [Alkalihalobacillus sp. NPDC078783]
MRSTDEMIKLIIDVANQDERIRAVGMNGSRTNPNVSKDQFQDYDIVYVVTDVYSFIQDPSWIDQFGKRIVMQTPEAIDLIPPLDDGTFAYLMLFEDGNRIDLTLVPQSMADSWNGGDELAVLLLDKDQKLPILPPSTDQAYWVQPPTQKLFDDCCNECWWVATYVAKGLWRGELTYAYDHLSIVRDMLIQMMNWKIGIRTHFSLSTGKNGKYLKRFLSEKEWKRFSGTYPRLETHEIWTSLFVLLEEFAAYANEVASACDYTQHVVETNKVFAYLKEVQRDSMSDIE